MMGQETYPYMWKALACPLDGQDLHYYDDNGSVHVRCCNGHSFDVARQGYINLLSVQDKRSIDPGDTKEMIAARGRILASGVYSRLADKLVLMVSQKLDVLYESIHQDSAILKTTFSLLDAGCGEGYYLDRCSSIESRNYSINAVGLDISKWAIMAAARRNKKIAWIVGSNKKPPIQANSIDIIFCGFGFPDFAAFKKILKPGGCVIMLDPAESHLLELRQIIYPVIKPYKDNGFAKALEVGYMLAVQQRLTYSVDNITRQQIHDILTMSPHLYKATAAGKEAAFALQSLDITIDVNFTILTI